MRNSNAMRQLLRMASAMAMPTREDEAEPLPISIDASATPAELVDAFVVEAEWWLSRPLRTPPASRQTAAGKTILALPDARQLAMLFEALRRAVSTPVSPTMSRPYALLDCAAMLLSRNLGYSERDLRLLLELVMQLSSGLSLGAPLFQALLPHLERQAAGGGLASELAELARKELELVRGFATGPEYRRLQSRVAELLSPAEAGLPEPDEPWSVAMLEWLRALDPKDFSAWQHLLAHAMRAEQSKPTAKWMKEAQARVDRIGYDAFKRLLLTWFGLLEAPAKMPLSQHNGQIVKGLAWACSSYGDPDLGGALGRMAEAMLLWLPAFPAMDWRCLRAGNACLYALSMMPSDEAVGQLSRLSLCLKGKQLQDSVGKALGAACARRGMSRADLEELVVPSLGPEEPGFDSTAKSRTRLSKAARKNTAVQRLRLERLLLANRSWNLADWRQRYEQQSLLSPLVSRLIWRFETADGQSEIGIPQAGEIIDVAGQRLQLDSASTRVRIWHPIESDAGTVGLWRRFLEERRIVQPFKQAHREIYVVTEADRDNPTASDRFAGHVLRQDQFKALCDERDWRYHIQGRWVPGEALATRALPEQDIRAELAVEPAGLDDQNSAAATLYRFLSTGQVRFLYSDASVCPLTALPPVAFSEIMRDVDLFVGVCSIGVDPVWNVRSSGGRQGSYWRDYALAELTEAAAARREMLVELLPRLSFASRCDLEGRFLVVRGDIKTYKIHIGSGNVLMSPNDVFLSIPSQQRNASNGEQVFLPFEGDTILAQILSKAAVLAGDSHLSNRALRQQIAADA